ncbi:hypothetical protein [Lederbergia graminis]|uniref:Uncharacterized protein n=1 Tax=Lederbergia graminis TaxID=735518 RepID=A0ABW0LLI9_9BACI|nr:hypothetical protein [Paenibacillus bovis]
MAEDIKVERVSQRNEFDVAVDLTKLYLDEFTISDEEEIEKQFATFYALAVTLKNTDTYHLQKLVPEEILNKLK